MNERITKKEHKNQAGFTLIEGLLSIIIIAILGVGVLALQFILSQNQEVVFKSYLSIEEANSSISEFTRQLRTAHPGENGAYAIESVDENEIVFYTDIDFDDETERVRYFLENTTLYRGVTEPTSEPPITYPQENEKVKRLTSIVRNLTMPVFTYYNGDWPSDTTNNPLTLPTDISGIKTVGINLRTNPVANESDKDYVMQSYINIRMLKENL
ncbi:prepilin-type N-terminal cleavage/methylation domain-containing protein [Candidatus Woesebacteria bacterium]|nr:prepilin-type N-terminal cleavage/methylation domain-containing protein [Candidatus Woesebacteria bacterium]